MFGRFFGFLPTKSGLLATFKNESGLLKSDPFSENSPFWVFFGPFWSICADLKKYLCQKPTCPLLFLFNCDKKIKDIYRYGQNKWAFDQAHKNHDFTNSIGFFRHAKKTYPFMKREE